MQNELYLEDSQLAAPPTLELNDEQLEAVRARVGALLQVLTPMFSNGGKVELERWIPSADTMPLVDTTGDGRPDTNIAAAMGGAGPFTPGGAGARVQSVRASSSTSSTSSTLTIPAA